MIGKRVPDTFGIDHHDGSILANVHATCMVDSDALDAEHHAKATHIITELPAALCAARAAPVARRPVIHATEHVNSVDRFGCALRR